MKLANIVLELALRLSLFYLIPSKNPFTDKLMSPFQPKLETKLANYFSSNTSGNKPFPPCSIRCLGGQGAIPTLQCRICLCLYHHECVGYTMHPTLPYVCKVGFSYCVLTTDGVVVLKISVHPTYCMISSHRIVIWKIKRRTS